MKYNPRTCQIYATEKILQTMNNQTKEGIGLFMDMGVGKTSSTLMAIKKLHENGKIKKVLLVSTIRIVDSVWSEEIKKWDDFKNITYTKILGDRKKRLKALEENTIMYGINIENLVWLVEHMKSIGKWDFNVIIIDESGEFFRSHKSNRFKAMKIVAPIADLVVELTGSPRPKSISDLWSQVYLLDGGKRLGPNITTFRDIFLLPDKSQGHVIFSWKPKPGADKKVYDLISDICVSMRASDWIDMPKRIDTVIDVEMPKKAKILYKELLKDRIIVVDDSYIVADDSAKLCNKLNQICSGAVYDECSNVVELHRAKIEAIQELVETLDGEPVMIAYNYIHELNRLMEIFPEAKQFKNSQDILDWNEQKIKIALVNPASVGHGLNLQDGGRYIIWFSLTYNLDHFIQLNRRLERPGQTKTVMIYTLICKNSIEEKILKLLSDKDYNQNIMLEAIKAEIKS